MKETDLLPEDEDEKYVVLDKSQQKIKTDEPGLQSSCPVIMEDLLH